MSFVLSFTNPDSSSEDDAGSEAELSESELIHARTKASLEASKSRFEWLITLEVWLNFQNINFQFFSAKRNRANNFDSGVPRIVTPASEKLGKTDAEQKQKTNDSSTDEVRKKERDLFRSKINLFCL